ncbi:MAG: HD domain-containing protein [Pseudomonadota bacterium]|jgi:HD superfamily phosphohydrolase
MAEITFADVVHQSISFSQEDPAERLVLDLIDTAWFQRLRDISQTANTRLVYMFSEHSRFGHCLGVSYLAKLVLSKLAANYSQQVQRFRPAILVAALLHDVGHLAPGSHTAFKTWFPGQPDSHEALAERVINGDAEIGAICDAFSRDLRAQVTAILSESDNVPAWTWQLISGGGWNVDRGNWSAVDSILAGVSYGKYNIPALADSIVITSDGQLALMENRLDAMMHFAVSRHAMYRQIYQHRVLLAADTINRAVVDRARSLGESRLFADDTMRVALAARSVEDLTFDAIFAMRESWWRYHLSRWAQSDDDILVDLSQRILRRKLFKTIRTETQEHREELRAQAVSALTQLKLDPRYYLHEISTADVHASDSKQSMLVQLDNGKVITLAQADPLFNAMASESRLSQRSWLAMPKEAKALVGRIR